jgi:hypothetical protein
LDPGLLRSLPSTQVLLRLEHIHASAQARQILTPADLRAVSFALDNHALFEACP